ncbi:MAG TPA: hypothetical protein VEH78_00715 [Pseudolabrys sp.]|nr:hypothetical protein [Pseudolabrys sp.]
MPRYVTRIEELLRKTAHVVFFEITSLSPVVPTDNYAAGVTTVVTSVKAVWPQAGG